MIRLLHQWRYATCQMCQREFHKGKGGGPSRSTICSGDCWSNAWREWAGKPLLAVTWPVES